MKLIVEMEMPKACRWNEDGMTKRCPIAEWGGACSITKLFEPFDDNRPSWCPICGELPEEHGDLIDRDKLLQTFQNADYETYNDYCEAFDTVEAAETVIAAERKDDEQIH